MILPIDSYVTKAASFIIVQRKLKSIALRKKRARQDRQENYYVTQNKNVNFVKTLPSASGDNGVSELTLWRNTNIYPTKIIFSNTITSDNTDYLNSK